MRIKKLNIFIYCSRVQLKPLKSEMHWRKIWKRKNIKGNVEIIKFSNGIKRA
jgi:hypothetical protein